MKQLFDIPEIHCASCVMLIEALEEDCPAVKEVRVNSLKKQAEIEWDESQMNIDELIAAVKELSSYKAVPHVG